jgi:hypothetical protein
MTILSSLVAQAGVAGEAARGGGYEIERSLRFNSADSAYLNRTPADAGNRQTWTWSGWVKRSALGGTRPLFGVVAAISGDLVTRLQFDTSNQLIFQDFQAGGSIYFNLITTQVFRDVSAWFHVVAVVDTTQEAPNSVKLYINGSQVTALGTATYPSLSHNTAWNSTLGHYIGREGDPNYFNGYLTEINFIDGQALDPTSFGEYNATTGVWQPKAYSGTYGTNGFYLNFSDNSTTDALGTDFSGNGNTWDDNGFVVSPVTSADNDSLVDTPTPYGTDTGVGGEVRGNYATANPLNKPSTSTITNGNLDVTHTNVGGEQPATIAISSGKWYWEATPSSNLAAYGIILDTVVPSANSFASGYHYYGGTGLFYTAASGVAYGATFTSGNVIGVALDLDNLQITFYKDNVSQGTKSISAGTYYPDMGAAGTNTTNANFGQRPFAHAAPSGFKALCTQNLPEPTIKDGSKYFDVVTYNGNGANVASGGQTISSLDFRPDWVWIKKRTGTPMTNHALFDVVRGANLQLQSNNTFLEFSMTEALVSFTGNGFTLGNSSNVNLSSNAYVAWNWAAGGEPTANNNSDGNIISTVSVSTESGFSIVTYTGNGTAGATVGHGLGVAPSMVIVKERQNTNAWCVYHSSIGATKFLRLNGTDAENTQTDIWNDTAPTSTVFSVGDAPATNRDANNLVAYCFAAIPGYSAFGSYKGNADPDGPFVYTGFRPAFLIIKRTTGDSWLQRDSVRNPYNVTDLMIIPNLAAPEYVDSTLIDFVSNGFKLRHQNSLMNQNGTSHIYMAFAENPFKYSLAR